MKFILEGIVTVILGIISIWIIVDFPDDANFLDPLEHYVVISRLKKDGQASHRKESLKWKSIASVFKDWKMYVGLLISMGVVGTSYAFSLALPSIIKELGFSTMQAQLLTVPPYFCACIAVNMSQLLC